MKYEEKTLGGVFALNCCVFQEGGVSDYVETSCASTHPTVSVHSQFRT
jgi:hypothetical protein